MKRKLIFVYILLNGQKPLPLENQEKVNMVLSSPLVLHDKIGLFRVITHSQWTTLSLDHFWYMRGIFGFSTVFM